MLIHLKNNKTGTFIDINVLDYATSMINYLLCTHIVHIQGHIPTALALPSSSMVTTLPGSHGPTRGANIPSSSVPLTSCNMQLCYTTMGAYTLNTSPERRTTQI
jgi:hypothetical protein